MWTDRGQCRVIKSGITRQLDGLQFANGGFDSTDFPTSINVNNINVLNDVLGPRRGIPTLWKFNHLREKLDTQSFRSFLGLTFWSV